MQGDFKALEKNAGTKAASTLKSSLRSTIQATFKTKKGLLVKSNITAKYKAGYLDRLTIVSPRYSYMLHYGSNKKGITQQTKRKGGLVQSYLRTSKNGQKIRIKSFKRRDATISAHIKNQSYPAYKHLSKMLQRSKPALETLANTLAENRAIVITSKIDF